MRVEIGDKIYLPSEKRPYKVQARNDRFIICTKPFNIQRTVLYFIIDLVGRVRGTDNMIFCMGYETQKECQERLKELTDGTIKVSCRNVVDLDVDVE